MKVRHGLNKEEGSQLDRHHQRDTKVADDQSKPINATWRSLKATQGNKTSREMGLNGGDLAAKHRRDVRGVMENTIKLKRL